MLFFYPIKYINTKIISSGWWTDAHMHKLTKKEGLSLDPLKEQYVNILTTYLSLSDCLMSSVWIYYWLLALIICCWSHTHTHTHTFRNSYHMPSQMTFLPVFLHWRSWQGRSSFRKYGVEGPSRAAELLLSVWAEGVKGRRRHNRRALSPDSKLQRASRSSDRKTGPPSVNTSLSISQTSTW